MGKGSYPLKWNSHQILCLETQVKSWNNQFLQRLWNLSDEINNLSFIVSDISIKKLTYLM